MGLLNRKSKLERTVETLESQPMLKSAARSALQAAVAGVASPSAAGKVGSALDAAPSNGGRPAGQGIKKVSKPMIIVGAGVAGATAASAAISSLRRHGEP